MMRTIEAETIKNEVLKTRDESTPVATVGNYEPVRFNAMKHGILSRLAVLAHEDHAEFDDLLAALIDEHRPAGITERHLIEELATIIWRKRRVLLAEGANINEGLKGAVNSAASVIKSAAPFERGLGGENAAPPKRSLNASGTRRLIWRQPKKRWRYFARAGRMPTPKRVGC